MRFSASKIDERAENTFIFSILEIFPKVCACLTRFIKPNNIKKPLNMSLEEYYNHSTYNFGKIDILIHFDRNYPALHESNLIMPTGSKLRATLKKLKNYSKN
jgi:hypothetical protein